MDGEVIDWIHGARRWINGDPPGPWIPCGVVTAIGNNYKIRVLFASRCEGDPSWAVEYIRQAAAASVDQSVFFGKPAMVLDRTNHLVHVALVEADDYRNGSDFANATTSSVYWYTKAYVPCP